ncbi:hypothetical protein [Parafrankia sp. BMG5.11]|uniref:hypothetical protein n=1 Tax=Parafrankia sp. BMG5.11 TaxID=222540 RepID=UPI0010DDB857|nr:hypothetical protein [Parafrankia sp. BMG5.11]TCJ41461.1 hypothetical protein E0504_02390 [Parafrankia sp. BMG5.11]
MLPSRLSLSLLALTMLSACGDQKSDEPERKTAAGEVLGGSISDSMLPLDTVQSQSPPLRESAADDSGAGPSEAADDDEEEEEAPAPSSSPSSSETAPAAPPAEVD